jgi:hypothetical protein
LHSKNTISVNENIKAKFTKGNVLHKLQKYFKNRQPGTGLRGGRVLHDNALSNKVAIV